MIDRDTHEYRLLEEMLSPGERVIMEVTERRLGGAPFFGVAHAFITSGRVIIIRRYLLNIHNSIKVIKYAEISDLQIECGLVFCKIHFAIKGEPTTEEGGGHKWLRGLWHTEAIQLINFMNKVEVKKSIPIDVIGSKKDYREE